MNENFYDDYKNNTLDHIVEGFQLIGFDWRYLYVNEAVVKQSKNSSKKDLIGYTMMEKYPGIERTEMFKVLQRSMKERVSQKLENEFTFPDNTKGWFELRIEPVPEGLFILSMDITERKIAEEEKKEHLEKLEKMLFITSHKVRKPISNIMGISNILSSCTPSHEELTKISGYMKESVADLDKFTSELTAFVHNIKVKAKNKSWI